MASVIFMMDFSEKYSRNILKGVSRYANEIRQPWNLCRLPESIRDVHGLEAVVECARKIKADAIIGQFKDSDNVELFTRNGIIAIAMDYKKRFDKIPNITGPHFLTGKMGAEYFLHKGFSHFAYFGVRNIVWSDERYEGFRKTIENSGIAHTFHSLMDDRENILWYYDIETLSDWLQSLPTPVAIMASDDRQAYQIVQTCSLIKAGNCRIPHDIAVLGVDNDEPICKLCTPHLSSIDQTAEQAGYDTAKLIERLIADPGAEWEDIQVMPTHIVTRQSTVIYTSNDPNINLTLQYIHNHITRKITVEELVENVPLSRRPLEIRFREVMGTTIHSYILKMRIEQMANCLHQGMSISEAAAELGFFDLKNLSRTFRRIMNATPTEYIEKIKRNNIK